MSRLITPIGSAFALVMTLAWSSPSLADDPSKGPDTTPQAPESAAHETDGAGAAQPPRQPDHAPPSNSHARAGASLVLTGFALFGVSYVPALYVANRSTLAADHKLDVPIAGPWLDLASRAGCAGPERNCSSEPGNTALLVIDGFVQAVSAIQVLAGLTELAHSESTRTNKKATSDETAVVVTPAAFGTGYGLGATGKF